MKEKSRNIWFPKIGFLHIIYKGEKGSPRVVPGSPVAPIPPVRSTV